MKRLLIFLAIAMNMIYLTAQSKEDAERKKSLAINIQNLFNKDYADSTLPLIILYHPLKRFDLRLSTNLFYNRVRINSESGFNLSNTYNMGLALGIQKKTSIIKDIFFIYGCDLGYRFNQKDELIKFHTSDEKIKRAITGHNIELKPFINISYSAFNKVSFALESYYVTQIKFIIRSHSNWDYSGYIPPKTSGIEIILPSMPATALLVTYHF